MSDTTTPTVPTVTRFEATLLRLVRRFVHAGTPDGPPSGKLTAPKCLGAACVRLVEDTLSKGSVLYLARAGGWRRERHLREGQAVHGRLWERTPIPELGLTFSGQSLDLLIWLTAGRPSTPNWEPSEASQTMGDRFLVYLAYETLREQEPGQALRGRQAVVFNGLVRLMFPEDFGSAPAMTSFTPWVTGAGASIIEALQPRLQRRWLELERSKNQIGDWARLRQVGQSQDQALTGFLDAADAARRPDLARFLIRGMAELLSPDLTPDFWIGGLQGNGPPRLADRLDTQRHGLAAVRSVERLGEWARRARNTGYLHEDYSVAQLWLADWEQLRGEELVTISHNLLRRLEPLRSTPAVAKPATEGAGQQ